MSIWLFLRDARRLLAWQAPSRYIALPLVQRMRMKSCRCTPTLAERWAMFWLLVPDIAAGWLLRKTAPTCYIHGWGRLPYRQENMNGRLVHRR